MFEALESRRLCTITPAHLALAERSVAETTPANNLYYNGTPAVTWNGINSATVTSVKADCTTYVTVLLKQAYGWTNAQWTSMFGVSSPSLTTYFNDAVADKGLDGFTQIADAKPGDLFICRYDDPGAPALGHMVMLDSLPKYVSTDGTYMAYNVTVIDVTGSPHTADTRTGANTDGTNDTGVGRGNIRFYTDMNGNINHWAWGTNTTSTTYSAATRPTTFAHVPALSIKAPSALKAVANGETAVNLNWTDNSGIEDGYVIQRSSDGGSTWASIGDVNSNVTTYTDATAKPGAFSYRVYAQAGASVSTNSAAASVTVNAIIPAMPTNMSAVISGANISVAWTDNASNEIRYVMERSVDNGPFTVLGNAGANVTTYIDSTATYGHIYSYRTHAESQYAVGTTGGVVTINMAARTADPVTPVFPVFPPIATPTSYQPPKKGTPISVQVLGNVPAQVVI